VEQLKKDISAKDMMMILLLAVLFFPVDLNHQQSPDPEASAST
jgi:hypothetical protein